MGAHVIDRGEDDDRVTRFPYVGDDPARVLSEVRKVHPRPHTVQSIGKNEEARF